jgi:hypothetical protein
MDLCGSNPAHQRCDDAQPSVQTLLKKLNSGWLRVELAVFPGHLAQFLFCFFRRQNNQRSVWLLYDTPGSGQQLVVPGVLSFITKTDQLAHAAGRR